jgi:hypothetical protein
VRDSRQGVINASRIAGMSSSSWSSSTRTGCPRRSPISTRRARASSRTTSTRRMSRAPRSTLPTQSSDRPTRTASIRCVIPRRPRKRDAFPDAHLVTSATHPLIYHERPSAREISRTQHGCHAAGSTPSDLQFQSVRTFSTSSSPRPTGRGAGQRPDGKQPSSLRPEGLRAGLYLRAAGYVPVGALWTGASHPRWPPIVSAAPNSVNPATRPIPPCGDVVEHRVSDELVG